MEKDNDYALQNDKIKSIFGVTMIENVCVYVYDAVLDVLTSCPNVNIVRRHIAYPKDFESRLYHIDDPKLCKYMTLDTEGSVLREDDVIYTVWFKEPDDEKAMKLLYKEICCVAEYNIQGIERRLNREKHRLEYYNKKLEEFQRIGI